MAIFRRVSGSRSRHSGVALQLRPAGIRSGGSRCQRLQSLLVRGKGKKELLVPVGRKARAAMNAWLSRRARILVRKRQQTDALLFSVGPHQSAERLCVRSINRTVRKVAVAKGLPPYHPHQLRHACASHMHDHGAPIEAISAMLGHAHLSTTQIYTRVSPGRMLDVYRKHHPHSKVAS